MNLREEIFRHIKDHKDYSKEELSADIYDILESAGLELYDNELVTEENEDDLAGLINVKNNDEIMMSAVAILVRLEDNGFGLDGNGWLDDDDEWYMYEKKHRRLYK